MKLFSSIETQEDYELSVFAETKNNIVTNNYYKGVIVLEENTASSYDICEFDLNNLQDDKVYNKYIEAIKKVCRSSFEYRKFVNFLRENMDMNKCSFFENVSNINSYKIKIHIHHHPLTLYDIVVIVYNKRSFFEESLEAEMVAKEAMYIHYFMMVGLIPLSETVHDLVHDQLIFIPLDKVMGNWEEFLDTYSDFIPTETLEKIERYKRNTLSFSEEENRKLLIQSPTYVKMQEDQEPDCTSVSYKLPEMNDIIDAMNKKIEDIKSKNYAIENKNIVDMKYDNISEDNKNKDKGIYRPIYFVD